MKFAGFKKIVSLAVMANLLLVNFVFAQAGSERTPITIELQEVPSGSAQGLKSGGLGAPQYNADTTSYPTAPPPATSDSSTTSGDSTSTSGTTAETLIVGEVGSDFVTLSWNPRGPDTYTRIYLNNYIYGAINGSLGRDGYRLIGLTPGTLYNIQLVFLNLRGDALIGHVEGVVTTPTGTATSSTSTSQSTYPTSQQTEQSTTTDNQDVNQPLDSDDAHGQQPLLPTYSVNANQTYNYDLMLSSDGNPLMSTPGKITINDDVTNGIACEHSGSTDPNGRIAFTCSISSDQGSTSTSYTAYVSISDQPQLTPIFKLNVFASATSGGLTNEGQDKLILGFLESLKASLPPSLSQIALIINWLEKILGIVPATQQQTTTQPYDGGQVGNTQNMPPEDITPTR